jgi:hypothetical protein
MESREAERTSRECEIYPPSEIQAALVKRQPTCLFCIGLLRQSTPAVAVDVQICRRLKKFPNILPTNGDFEIRLRKLFSG